MPNGIVYAMRRFKFSKRAVQEQLVLLSAVQQLPVLKEAAGERAAYRFLKFFTAQIRNTRRAYAHKVGDFLALAEARQLDRGNLARQQHMERHGPLRGKATIQLN